MFVGGSTYGTNVYIQLYTCCNQKVKTTCMQLVDANLYG